jgi:hypothetical protein
MSFDLLSQIGLEEDFDINNEANDDETFVTETNVNKTNDDETNSSDKSYKDLDYEQIKMELNVIMEKAKSFISSSLGEYEIASFALLEFINKFNNLSEQLDNSLLGEEPKKAIKMRNKIYEKVGKIYRLFDEKVYNKTIDRFGYKYLRKGLEENDIYYNLFFYTKKLEYLEAGLKFSNMELLNIIDETVDPESKYNKMKRYEQYILLLHRQFAGKKFNYNSMIKIFELEDICKKDIELEDFFNEIFGMELVYMEQYKIKKNI